MRKIHRYAIPVTDETQSIQLPKGGRITHCDSKSGIGFVDFWVLFDEDTTEVETRHFVTVPTGQPIDDELAFVGTVLQRSDNIFGGALVWHVFEKFV